MNEENITLVEVTIMGHFYYIRPGESAPWLITDGGTLIGSGQTIDEAINWLRENRA